MEPITHFLTGACIGRAGLNRKSAYATLTAVLAAEAADIDILWALGGPVDTLKHHRGITHTLWAAPVLAVAAVGLVWCWDAWKKHRRGQHSRAADQPVFRQPKQAVHWGWLYGTALLSALAHLFLDWSNGYGLRPFFPLNPRWYAGSLIYIAEPAFWVFLLLAVLVPALTGLIGGEIGERRPAFRGRGWAIFALCAMTIVGGWRWSERARALNLLESDPITKATVRRVAVEPYPINPFRWHGIVETADAFQSAEINTRTGAVDSDALRDRQYKPTVTPAVAAARQSALGQVYLDWGSWAVMRDLGPVAVPGLDPPQLPPGRHWTTVEFSDLRFDYGFAGREPSRRRRPLTGWVYIVDDRDEAGQVLGGRVQR